ncbi:MAG: ribonuclease III [Ruminococcaceae bacterium]|nr:ribonuclease III [Oscillospiraceae bacterium]
MLPKDIMELESAIAYSFRKKELLKTALTHSSYSNELRAKKISVSCNERLEFLGDSVLSIIVSEYLFKENRYLPEGELTKLRKELVCGRTLADLARGIGLGEYLLLGNGEEKNGGRENDKILENAFEALLAAMYLDAEGEGKAVVSHFLMPRVKVKVKEIGHGSDFKTALQQFVQQTEGDFLEYAVVGESGPDHNKVYTVEARLNSNVIGRGSGRTKKEAEQNAAKEGLALFGED